MTNEKIDDADIAVAHQPHPGHQGVHTSGFAARFLARAERPVLAPAALHGLAGDIVRTIEPITEASGAAMLVTLLVAFSAMVGKGAHVFIGEEPHYPNLFAVIIGDTARARKGTSFSAVEPILVAADRSSPSFLSERVLRGINSGEGLIQAAAAGPRSDDQDPHADPSATSGQDQRLLVFEEEYGRLLTVAGRQNCTISPILRTAWDGRPLASITRRERLTADRAHVCVLAHITSAELLARTAGVDILSGYANRFLHVFSHRTTLLPNPGRLDPTTIARFGDRLHTALVHAQAAGEISRDAEFNADWDALYRTVESQPTAGVIYDALTPRASPYIIRLSLVFALLDRSNQLRREHLAAATALWDYCEATVAHVYGMTLGGPHRDRLWAAVAAAGAEGLAYKQIHELFFNNLNADEVKDLIATLVSHGLAHEQTFPTAGRPRTAVVANTSM